MTGIQLPPSWEALLKEELTKPYFEKLTKFINKEYESSNIFPEKKNIYRAFERCPFDQVKVVILGQDPYHGPNQANGLCFSVNEGVQNPPSLKNIFKEISSDTNIDTPESGNLDRWADQGVLLLNATLTVRAREAGSHQKKGWEQFTDAVIKKISDKKEDIVFLLWGNYAKKKGLIIDCDKHYVLESPHPSPFSAYTGFFGCHHFSNTNKYLKKIKKKSINWS
jgi:uracil-DNA glycosylase